MMHISSKTTPQTHKTSSSGSGGKMEIFWGQSYTSYDDAILAAVAAAKAALPDATLEWFEVTEFRGGFNQGAPQFQTAIRIGYVQEAKP